jgi:4-hydroxy-4-methyl-2-oxoglutarate aldolase
MEVSCAAGVGPQASIWARAGQVGAASLHEAAGRIGALPHALKPISRGMRISAPAFPVQSPRGDNLWLHLALAEAPAGSVIVADVGEGESFGYWGEVMARAAIARGLAGLVLTGGVRDSARLAELGFPTFCASIAIQGTLKDFAGAGSLRAPVRIGEITVAAGDLIVGDDDGLVCIPDARAEEIVCASEHREADEADIFRRLEAGELTLDIYNLRKDAQS